MSGRMRQQGLKVPVYAPILSPEKTVFLNKFEFFLTAEESYKGI